MNLADAIRKAGASPVPRISEQTAAVQPVVAAESVDVPSAFRPEEPKPASDTKIEMVPMTAQEVASVFSLNVPAGESETAQSEEDSMTDGNANEEHIATLAGALESSTESGGVVRFEFRLDAEDLSMVLRQVMARKHGVLTLREAAAFLRISPHALTEMAEKSEVPAIMLDGRWRFPKTALTEWLEAHSRAQENDIHVA